MEVELRASATSDDHPSLPVDPHFSLLVRELHHFHCSEALGLRRSGWEFQPLAYLRTSVHTLRGALREVFNVLWGPIDPEIDARALLEVGFRLLWNRETVVSRLHR